MIGQKISHYQILEKLGGGGMGVVYKAQDLKLDRFVALKFLSPHLSADEDEKKRFIYEAKAASALDHPNICTIHEIGETEDGQLFIAMACYDGETLKQKIVGADGGPPLQLSITSVIDIAIQISQGLAKAHAHGIIHRDIKPANVIVTKDGIVKILDFGLAKLAGGTQLTKTGTAMGTVAYMSPEQVQRLPVDHRSDIWSLGVVLYEMLTGKLPFEGEHEQPIMYGIVNDEPTSVRSLKPEVNIGLEQIVHKALAKELAERYQHIDEVLVDLKRPTNELESREIFSWKRRSRSTKRKARKRIFIEAAAALVLALFVVGYFIFTPKPENEGRVPIAVIDFLNETGDHELDGLSGLLITDLEQSRRLEVLTRSRMFDLLQQLNMPDLERIDEKAGRAVCKAAKVTTMAIGTVKKFGELYTVDVKVIDLERNKHLFAANVDGRGKESIPSLIDQIAERTRIDFNEPPENVRASNQKVAAVTTTNLEAYQHFFAGEYFLNKWRWQEAQEEFQKVIAIDSTYGLAYYRLAYAKWDDLGSEHLQKDLLQKAFALLDRIPEKERYLVRAHLAFVEKGAEAALAILKDVEQLYPNEKEIIYNIGDYSCHSGDYVTAMEYLEKLLIMEPAFERVWYHLAEAYRKVFGQSRDFSTGLSKLQQLRNLFPDKHAITVMIADFYVYQEKYEQAETELMKLIEAQQSYEVKRVGYERLSCFYPYMGKYEKALWASDKKIELYWQAKDTAWAATGYNYKGLLRQWGWTNFDNAWKEAEKAFPYNHRISLGPYWTSLFDLCIFQRKYAMAESLAKQKLHVHPDLLFSALYSSKHECAKAQALIEIELKSKPKFNTTGAAIILKLFLLAQCQFEEAELDDATKSLFRLQKLYINDFALRAVFYPKSFYLLGQIYEKKGNKQRAIENYTKLLHLWKDADEDLPELIDTKARLVKLRS